jgi:hypothetical protein
VTNEEKIRLVLETLGTDNVRQAARAMRELEKATEDVGRASTVAAGKPGVNGQGMLQLAYFIDDMQYGIRGVMNNIPTLVQALGLGTGLAGVAGIAAVAVGTLVEKHPEWFKWNEKVKLSLAELIDAIKAEEEAVKRQKDEVDKLGKSTSQRIEDILKLKTATESLQEAEAKLAEDRKNAKAADEADKNAGAIADDELKRQKDVVKSVITDAGLQGDLKNNLLTEIDKATPQIGANDIDAESRKIAKQRVPFFDKMDEDTKSKIAGTFRGQALAGLQQTRMTGVTSSMEGIFGGLMNPANQEEMNQAMQGLDQFLPGVSRELRGVYQFDRDAEAFDADIARRQAAGARRRAAEREAATAAQRANAIGPNREMFEAEQNRQLWQGRQKTEAELTQEAEIRNAALAQFDPTQMAALRNAQAGMGGMRNRNLAGLRQRDMALFQNALVQRGMAPGAAEQAARESLSGGEQQFEQFSQDIGKNLGNGLRAQEATVEYFKMLNIRMEEYAQQMQMLMQQMNMMGGTDVRPQQNRARN